MRKVLSIICVVLIITLIIAGVAIRVYTDNVVNKTTEMYEQIEHTNLLTYEACTSWVTNLVDLYSVGTEATKEQLQQQGNIKQAVWDNWWRAHSLNGEDRVVELVDVQYAVPKKQPIMDVKSTFTFLVLLQVKEQEDMYLQYVVAKYTDGVLVDLHEIT